MPLTQEKRLDSNFSNNNDHNYLHKKFKKMATTTVFPSSQSKTAESRFNGNISQPSCDTSISNGSIAAAHPEIHKIYARIQEVEKNVQTNFSSDSNRLSNVNNVVQVTGPTSVVDEFSNKTENPENDFVRDTYNGGTAGRYVCPYCKLSCAKPSVLEKHIRAHTNERPYPCVPCGFAFKTKSNLYKHRRSRAHALRLQGADVSMTNEEDLSGGSESDTSTPPISIADVGLDALVTRERSRPNEFSSPELSNDCTAPSTSANLHSVDSKSKSIYKPKFRAAFYQDSDEKDRLKKSISHNADFLTEHISKIISDNEAIVDVIDTPLQKKYGKIKQIAESKQFLNDNDLKSDQSPLNLTKNNNELEGTFRKRSHSESFSNLDQKHPLNPEGSIIKDLLLKTKTNGMFAISGELVEGVSPLFMCPVCQVYTSAENLEVHRYYCKGTISSNTYNIQKDIKPARAESVYVRSNSINVRLPETQSNSYTKADKNLSMRNKPDNLVIIKPESNEVIAPLPSPGPLLGNTRLVDTRIPSDYNRKIEGLKCKPIASPKRRIETRSDTYSPGITENHSPRSADLYPQQKLRFIEAASALRPLDDHMRFNTTSLQMFGGEVKIVDQLGSTTTLRIEPSKNQLSPILIQQNHSPSKLGNDAEASSVVVRSGLHSGGTMVHNPPTPKEVLGTPQPQTPRISVSSVGCGPNMHDITHFQFPPLSAITAFNPLTLPPLSPSSSPGVASTILHGGKLIPHVPGIPGPNTPGTFVNSQNQPNKSGDISKTQSSPNSNSLLTVGQKTAGTNYEQVKTTRSSLRPNILPEKHSQDTISIEKTHPVTTIPLIKVKNVDEPHTVTKMFSPNTVKTLSGRQDIAVKRNVDGVPIMPVLTSLKIKKDRVSLGFAPKIENKSDSDIRNFNFENLITKAEIYNNQIPSSSEVQKNTNTQVAPSVTVQNERSETSYFQKSTTTKSATEERKSNFLRPSTLPLKPGTFTPKRHHGITPNANTMPLVSPETPRPAKAYGQLYLNGNAYTYLGLKCSTKVFYCTINRPQPTYVPDQRFLSMYSNWQLLSELTPDPLGLSASSAMSLYDSRHRPQSTVVAVIKQDLILTHSSQWNKNFKENKQGSSVSDDSKKLEDCKPQFSENSVTPKKELTGGFESNEEYTYVRGRGRGRYVCSECGIRCKKPSMLKKHIRTHTDVRPYTCTHCAFSFKTKGNLTKHMKSKAHYKKCCELGINPNEGNDGEGGELAQSGETDDDTESDGDEGNEGETESSDTEICKSRLPEHEAAHCLLSLGGSRPATSATPGLITSARPTTYPYTPIELDSGSLDLCLDLPKMRRSSSVDSRPDTDNEPMDLSKAEVKSTPNITEIPTAHESSVLASLASNTAKLPQHHSQWSNGEPMLHTYLTERALLDSKIKQSQFTTNLSKLRKVELEQSLYVDENTKCVTVTSRIPNHTVTSAAIISSKNHEKDNIISKPLPISKEDFVLTTKESIPIANLSVEPKRPRTSSNAENAKHVVSEYLKQARINLIKSQDESQNACESNKDDSNAMDDKINDEPFSDSDSIRSSLDHDPVARIVIGAGGVEFRVTKNKEFENSSYSPGRLMEDGRKVCDLCNKTFTKPSQLRLHLNIHYMERPFRCSVCAVSFRTRGHLQKHERSGSHHNKVSMTSTFGAATSFNPRPFRCSDCNIAFRIHGHLAKHLRSKMHVMRLECLFKLPFGTFTEIERAGVSLTDIDTTDCASSLASLQSLARKLHEKDPTKLEYREPTDTPAITPTPPAGRESSEDEDGALFIDRPCDTDKDSEMVENCESNVKETKVNYSATDN